MQSGQVNASQLLAAFLGKAKEKLGEAITKNDFSGELAKHLPKQPTAAGTPDLQEAATVGTDVSTADSMASAKGSPGFSEAKAGASLAVHLKGLTASSSKIKEINSKADTERSLFVSNPAIVETVLAKLHYPAKTRDECVKLLDKQGRLSIQNLMSILGARPDAVSGAATGVSAASVRTLLESVVEASDNKEGKAIGVAKSFKPSVAVKQDGSYTRSEFIDLLKKVVQASQKNSEKTQSSAISSATPTAVRKKTVEGLKKGQAEELVSTVLPSFVSSGREGSSASVLAANTAVNASGSQDANGKRTHLGKNQVKAVSGGSNSPERVRAEKAGLSAGGGERIAAGMETVVHGGENGSPKASASDAVSSRQKRTVAASAALGAETELAASIKAGMTPEQQGAGAPMGTTGALSLKDVQSRAELGGQDTAMLGKHIERLTGGKEQSSENGVLQTAEANPGDSPINLPRMDNSGGDGFVFYDRNRPAEYVQKARGAKTIDPSTASQSNDGIANVLVSYISPDEPTGSTAAILTAGPANLKSDLENNVTQSVSAMSGTDWLTAIEQLAVGGQGGGVAATPIGQPAAGKEMKASGKSSVLNVSNSAKSGGSAGSDKAAAVTGGGGGVGTTGAGSGPSTASASAWAMAQQEAVSMPSGLKDQSAQTGNGKSSNSSLENNAAQSVSATGGTDSLTAVEQLVAGGQGRAEVPKRIAEPAAGKDSLLGPALVQASVSNPHAINMPLADNSAQSSFAMYDPYLAVELANSMREQMGSGTGRLLVLDMEPEGLGKINLKVQAGKDEISVVALTQNEPARQALMSHSVELRQDLKNQGIVLGKFMVDVNAGNSGRENSAGANQSGGKGRGESGAAKVRNVKTNVKTSEAPIQPSTMSGRSQISIFA